MPHSAWEYAAIEGLVDNSCDPYFDKEPCKHPGCSPEKPTPQCIKKCQDGDDWKARARIYSIYGFQISQLT